MIVLGIMGRPDRKGCHDAAACLVVDGVVVGALEQERLSRRRHAQGEGPEEAVRTLLTAHGVHPGEVAAIGYAWADAPPGADHLDTDLAGGAQVTDRLTDVIFPGLGRDLGTRDIFFFDHHLCHAAQVYAFNSAETADILVADGWGGDGSTSLFHADRGRFRLLERYEEAWSLGLFYQAATVYADLGWWGQGKLMGLSSYGRPTGRRFLRYDPTDGRFQPDQRLTGTLTNSLDELFAVWLDTFATTVSPYSRSTANAFDYAPFAADVQATLEELGLGLAARLRRLSGAETLLLSGGVMLNAHMNGRLARESGYRRVHGSVAPHDGGVAAGAAVLAMSLRGRPIRPRPADGTDLTYLGPEVTTAAIERALHRYGVTAETLEPPKLRAEVANALERGEVVAYFQGRAEYGPRALGARSMLASPRHRSTLDKVNRIKGREPWRPAALALTAGGFDALQMQPPVTGLSEYMLCTHEVGFEQRHRVAAGVHVDGTSRAQLVPDDNEFGRLLAETGRVSGLPGLINTSLNARGLPMVLTPDEAVELMVQESDLDVLALPPYLVRRG